MNISKYSFVIWIKDNSVQYARLYQSPDDCNISCSFQQNVSLQKMAPKSALFFQSTVDLVLIEHTKRAGSLEYVDLICNLICNIMHYA